MQILLWTIISYPELSPIAMNSQPPIHHHSSAFISALELARSLPPIPPSFFGPKIITNHHLQKFMVSFRPWVSAIGGFKLAKRAYLALRPFAQLFAALLQVGSDGAGCAKLAQQPMAAVAGVQERLRVEERSWKLGHKGNKRWPFHDISWRLWWFMGIYGTILNDFRKLIGIYGDFGRWMFMAGNQEA